MFYIPADAQFGGRLMPEMKEEAKKLIVDAVNAGYVELIPHGLTHIPREFENASYDDMAMTLKAYEEHFKELGVPYVKGFKAPYWLMSKEALKCLDDNDWWLAIDRNQPDCPKAKRNYVYSWDIKDLFPKEQEHVRGHGHISLPSANNLPDCIPNLSRIPQDYTWRFISEVMDEN
jgi:hypothetical protein